MISQVEAHFRFIVAAGRFRDLRVRKDMSVRNLTKGPYPYVCMNFNLISLLRD